MTGISPQKKVPHETAGKKAEKPRTQQTTEELVICTVAGAFIAIKNPYKAATGLSAWSIFAYWAGLILLGNLSGTALGGFLQARQPAPALPVLLVMVSLSAAMSVTTGLVATR